MYNIDSTKTQIIYVWTTLDVQKSLGGIGLRNLQFTYKSGKHLWTNILLK